MRQAPIEPSEFTAKSERLILRTFTPEDYPIWREAFLARGKKQSAYDSGPMPRSKLTKHAYTSWLLGLRRAWHADLLYMVGAFKKDDGANVGVVNFGVLSRLTYQFANLGYEIHNQHWGEGYASEAVRAAIPLALRTLKLHRIEAGIDPRNKASIRVAENAGMIFEGRREKYYFDGKKWLDLVYYRSLAEDHGIKRVKPVVATRLVDLL